MSALLVVVSLWPCLTSSPASRPWLCAACLLCLALAVFPLLPVTDHGTNLVLASAPGLPLSLVGALLLAHPTARIMLVSQTPSSPVASGDSAGCGISHSSSDTLVLQAQGIHPFCGPWVQLVHLNTPHWTGQGTRSFRPHPPLPLHHLHSHEASPMKPCLSSSSSPPSWCGFSWRRLASWHHIEAWSSDVIFRTPRLLLCFLVTAVMMMEVLPP